LWRNASSPGFASYPDARLEPVLSLAEVLSMTSLEQKLIFRYNTTKLSTQIPMSHPSHSKNWYNVETVVEMLIYETPRGEKYAPHIGNLCVGFTELTIDGLEEEIEDMRCVWPFVFPKTLQTKEVIKLIKKKYPAYREILALREV